LDSLFFVYQSQFSFGGFNGIRGVIDMCMLTRWLSLLFVSGCVCASTAFAGASDEFSQDGTLRVLSRGPHTTDWQCVCRVTNTSNGKISLQTNHFTELATGLNRASGTGWEAARDSIDLIGDVAIARGG
jgi:hypothetical protein